VTIRLSMVKDLDHRFEVRVESEIGSRERRGNCSPKIMKCELATCKEGIRTIRSQRAQTVDLGQEEFMKLEVGRKKGDVLQNHKM
jgi:hypothetical protein